jgi:hypothetical protein
MSDNKPVISDEAVEAAHRAWRAQNTEPGTIFEYNLRAALEAAAPYLKADAWEEGFDWGKSGEYTRLDEYEANPYRGQAYGHDG